MDNNNKKLTRSRSDRMLAGVCGGLAAYFGLDPSLDVFYRICRYPRVPYNVAYCSRGKELV